MCLWWRLCCDRCHQGADPNATDNDSLTPLLLAATKKAWNAVDLLLQRKPDLTKRDTRGRNILHLMIMNGGSLDRMSVCLCNRVSCEHVYLIDDDVTHVRILVLWRYLIHVATCSCYSVLWLSGFTAGVNGFFASLSCLALFVWHFSNDRVKPRSRSIYSFTPRYH